MLIAVWLLLVLLGGGVSLFAYYHGQSTQFRGNLDDRALATLEAIAGALQAHLHNNRYHPDQVTAICEHMQRIPHVTGVRIDAGEERPLASAGEALPPDLSLETGRWQGTRYLRAAAFVEAETYTGGPGYRSGERGPSPRGGWMPFPEGPARLSLALDTALYHEQLRGLRLQTGMMAAGIALLGFFGAWLIVAGERHSKLEGALEVAQERTAQLQRLAQLGAGLAHETKNPLGIVRGLAQSIEQTEGIGGVVRRQAQQIVDEADRTVGQINGFITLARPQPLAPAPVDLGALYPHLLELLRPEATARGVTLEPVVVDVQVLADEAALRRALLNLLLNALHACGPGASITLGAERTGATVRLFVQDTGEGIPADLLPRVREPYVSGRQGGTGLGLSIVEMIAQEHGWRLEVCSEEEQGTLVSLEGVTVV